MSCPHQMLSKVDNENLQNLDTFSNCDFKYDLVCPDGWTFYSRTQKCYRVFPIYLPWQAARDKCRELAPDMKGDLASIPDQKTQNFISSLYYSFNYYRRGVWIGGMKKSDGQWGWSDGSRFSFKYWQGRSNGKPKRRGSVIQLFRYGWEDQTGKSRFNPICQQLPMSSK